MKIEMIRDRRLALDGKSDLMKEYTDRQDRLKALVEVHGIESVAVASGLSETTVRQYCRTRMPSTIGEKPVSEAEVILKGL